MTDASLLSALGGLGTLMMTALAVTVWYTITRADKRQDAERRERMQAAAVDREMFLRLYKEERDARDVERTRLEEQMQRRHHDARDELNVVAAKQALFELYCAREYVSYPRLTEALKPVIDSQERIFERLDGKQDKSGSGH